MYMTEYGRNYGQSHLILPSLDIEDIPLVYGDEVKATTLIQLSGGVDSTYVLWKWLKEHPDEYCVVHHIVMEYSERKKKMFGDKRHFNEREAVDKILKWLDSQGLNNYFYIENKLDWGNFLTHSYDVETCGFFAGVILRSERWESVKNVILPIYGYDSDRELNRLDVMDIISYRNDINVYYPLSVMEKWQVINELPEELFNLTFYCRTPEDGRQCGKCFTCQEVSESLVKIEQNKILNFLEGK